MLFGSSDSPLADQRSVMVAETGLKWQDNGEPAVFQVSVMYKVPPSFWFSFRLCALSAAIASISARNVRCTPSRVPGR
jgi:hypothetical protein